MCVKEDPTLATMRLSKSCSPGRQVGMGRGKEFPLGCTDGPLGITHDFKLADVMEPCRAAGGQ
eukprot:4183304-Alexandrium_andersonii.AAC.1